MHDRRHYRRGAVATGVVAVVIAVVVPVVAIATIPVGRVRVVAHIIPETVGIPEVGVAVRIVGKGAVEVRVVGRTPERVVAEGAVGAVSEVRVIQRGGSPERVVVVRRSQSVADVWAEAIPAAVAEPDAETWPVPGAVVADGAAVGQCATRAVVVVGHVGSAVAALRGGAASGRLVIILLALLLGRGLAVVRRLRGSGRCRCSRGVGSVGRHILRTGRSRGGDGGTADGPGASVEVVGAGELGLPLRRATGCHGERSQS
ncbi:hypothetical protein WDZ92_01150 [Nostoc sp. NIES-2111]